METPRLRRIVVGTDFGPSAAAALALALELARLSGAGLTLVHVCEPTEEHGFDAHGAEDVLERCRSRVAEMANASEIAITPILRSGRPADKIHNVATEVGASLIVIGRGRRVELGGVAAGVLLGATRPVLAVSSDALEIGSEP